MAYEDRSRSLITDENDILVYIPEEAEESGDQGHQVYAYEPTNKYKNVKYVTGVI